MSGIHIETRESVWTMANLQKLLAALKTIIPDHDRSSAYTKTLKTVDWNKVAFPPFSPEECQEKWREILQKMRKTRSLIELIVEAEDGISNPGQNNNIHPELPKRPRPPNAIFYEENCAKFHEKDPTMRGQKLFGSLNKMYTALPDEEKAQYVEKFKLATEEYKRRMHEFRKQNHLPRKCGRRMKRKRGEQYSEDEDGLPPKPPLNGYKLFCKEQLTCMGGVSKNAYVSVWAQRWRKLTERQKEEYNARCRELKRQYSIDLNEFLMTLDEKEQQQILKKHGIKRPKGIGREVNIVRKFPGEPKMPPRSGNIIFCKEQMDLLKEKFWNPRERLIKANQLWQDLSNREKTVYNGKVHESVRKYTVELQKWFTTLTAAEQEDYRTCNPRKCKYLDDVVYDREELCMPSDSEDEDLEDSSSDEVVVLDSEEDEEEEEEEGEIITFDMF